MISSRRVADGEAGDAHRAAGMRAAAGADAVGVVGDEIDALERHAEPFAEQLREAGLVALAAVHRAEHQLDAAFGAHRDLGALARRAAGAFDVIGDADAAQLAALRATRPCARQSRSNRRARSAASMPRSYSPLS